MRQLTVAAFALAIVALATVAWAAENPTGSWKYSMPGRGGQDMEMTIKLKLEGDKLTGTVPGFGGGAETAISDGKYKDGELSFSVVREGRDGTKRTTKYTGKLTGDTIKGKIEMPARGGGDPTTRDWEAKRVKE